MLRLFTRPLKKMGPVAGPEDSSAPVREEARAPEDLVAAVDVGSSRVGCALAESRPGGPCVLAVEAVPSYGIRGGEIVDLERAGESIRAAVESVGARAQVDIRSVVVGCSGDVKLHLARGTLDLDREHRAVQEADVARLQRSLWPAGGPRRRVVHRFDGPFGVGELDGIERPVGLSGPTLSMTSAFLTAPAERIENLLKAVRLAGVEIEDLALDPLVSSRGVLTADERALGVALLDFGAGGFRAALWEGGRLRQICSLGREHPAAPSGAPAGAGGMEGVVLSLARHFRLAPSTAQRLLQEHGFIGGEAKENARGEPLAVPAADGLEAVRIDLAELGRVLEECLSPAAHGLRDGLATFTPGHAGGVVLAGQGARLPGLASLVSRHFGGAPVRMGTPRWTLGANATLPHDLEGPGGAALGGLLAVGMEARTRLRARSSGTWWGRMRSTARHVAASL